MLGESIRTRAARRLDQLRQLADEARAAEERENAEVRRRVAEDEARRAAQR